MECFLLAYRLYLWLSLQMNLLRIWGFSFFFPFRCHNKRISIITSPGLEELARASGLFDDIIPCDYKSLLILESKRIIFYRHLYALHPEITVNLMVAPGTDTIFNMMIAACRAKLNVSGILEALIYINMKPLQRLAWVERWRLSI